MSNFESWREITKGLYRYVIAANACYEIHIWHWDFDTDILMAKASLFVVGDWTESNGNSFFERECLLDDRPVFECIEAAQKDYNNNN